MKSALISLFLWTLLFTQPVLFRDLGAPSAVETQQSTASAAVDTDQIVRALTAKETEFRAALAQYRFKRDVVAQTIGQGGQISGEYHRTSQLILDESGKRIEKILFFPTPTLSGIGISSEDLDDLGGIKLFALETANASLYNFKYAGKERIDELDLHVFEVSPKVVPDAKKAKDRLFQGRVWVDTQTFQIVKTLGKGVPQSKINPYPTLEVYREEIDGRYWFPTYAYADEELVLASGQPVKIRVRIRFSDFEKATRK